MKFKWHDIYTNFGIFGTIMCILVLIELGITLAIYFSLRENDNKSIRSTMNVITDNILLNMDTEIEKYKQNMIRTTAIFRRIGIFIPRTNYSDMMQFEYPFISNSAEANLWIPRISNLHLYEFQNFCRENIIENCTINELNFTSLTLIPVILNRNNYWPVTFYEYGLDQFVNKQLIGFDLNSTSVTSTFIENAIKTTNFSSWVRTTLSKPSVDNPYSYGSIINLLSMQYINDTNPVNIDHVIGIVSIVLNNEQVLDISLKPLNIGISRKEIDVFMFDITDDSIANNKSLNSSLLYKENKLKYNNIWISSDISSSFSIIKKNYTFIDRQWVICFKFSKAFINNEKGIVVIIVPSVLGSLFILVDIILIIFIELVYAGWKYMLIKKEKEHEKNLIASQMLNYVNHEIRNPLNVIKGLACYILDLLKTYENKSSEHIPINKDIYVSMVSDLSTMTGACDMLEHIVTDILDIRKLESGKLELANKNVNVNDFIHDLTKTIMQKINEKQTIELIHIYDKDLVVYLDPYRLKQILLNYLTNAIKYTDEGTITIKIDECHTKTRFSVIDTGRGIKDEDKYKIFQPFTQVMPEDASRYGGIGLGLHLCNMLAKRMDGTVGFESKSCNGSTFWVEFKTEDIRARDIV